MKKITSNLLLLISLILLVNCSSDSNENNEQILGTITTEEVLNITTTSVTFSGNLISAGSGEVSAKGVVFGTNANPTLNDNVELSNNNNLGNFTINISGLIQNTTYYVRAFVTTEVGTNYGEEKLFTTLTFFQATCLPLNLQNGVIAFYPFSSGSLNDYSGYNHNLTNPTTASSTNDRSGNSNCAFNFIKANNEFVKITDPAFLDNYITNPYTISVWIKPSGTRDGGDYEGIINRIKSDNNSLNASNWGVGLHDCRQTSFITCTSNIWEFVSLGETNCSTASNSWHHIIATFDGTACNIYVDNMQQNLFSSSITNPIIQNFSDLLIGKDFTGAIDDVIIYDRVLSNSERTQLYNLNGCCN